LLIRRIRELLYEQGFTISGARNKLDSRMGQGEDIGAEVVEGADNDRRLHDIRIELAAVLTLLKI
jgi:hypothetical protein